MSRSRHRGSELAQIRDYSIKGRLVSRELAARQVAARQVFYPLADFANSKNGKTRKQKVTGPSSYRLTNTLARLQALVITASAN